MQKIELILAVRETTEVYKIDGKYVALTLRESIEPKSHSQSIKEDKKFKLVKSDVGT